MGTVMERVRAAVVGAGNMGRHHVRVLGSMPDVDLVGIVDPDAERASTHAASADTSLFASLEELPDVDFAVVATPTEHHVETALALIARGVHLLVEKPLAGTPEDAERIIEAAEQAGVVVSVGHIERFNAAVSVLAGLVDEPLMISIERLSPYTPRIRDSVVFDLMVHDLDLACWIAGGYPVQVEAAGSRVFSETVDVASAVLKFENGCVATLQASRATQDKVRRIAVTERDRFILADTIRQDVSIKRETSVQFEENGMYRQANVVEVPYLDRSGEPLARQLRSFVDAIATGTAPLVTARDGLAAVRLAYEVEQAASR